jgi:hypothetical protein
MISKSLKTALNKELKILNGNTTTQKLEDSEKELLAAKAVFAKNKNAFEFGNKEDEIILLLVQV